MKTELKLNSLLLYKPTLFLLLILFFTACKKEPDFTNSSAVSSNQISDAKTDGIIRVQAGILPPVTQKRFIANGQTSEAEFQIRTSKHIFLYQLIFADSSHRIEYIVVNGYGIGPNSSGTITFDATGPYIEADSGYTITVNIHYRNVDSAASGSVSKLNLLDVVYRTDDEVYHDFYPGNAGRTQPMCLVNNIAHITFQNPGGDTLKNGYSEVAQVLLTGDTSWILNALPINISAPLGGNIADGKLIVKSLDKKVPNGNNLQLIGGGDAQTIIKFRDGFKHEAGITDTLKIYAPVTGNRSLLITTLEPLSSFVWTDDLGKKIGGGKNNGFYKEQTGQSEFH